MSQLMTDPAGQMEGGSWESNYPLVDPSGKHTYWGIFVGVNDSSPLYYAPWNDSMQMKKELENHSMYAEAHDVLLLGGMIPPYNPPPGYPPFSGNASWNDVNDSIMKVYNNCADGDIVVFYFSGHGWRDVGSLSEEPDGLEEGIVLFNATGDQFVSDDMLFDAFSVFENKPNVGLILIFDSCHSGGMVDGGHDLQNLENPHAILMACLRNETSTSYYLVDEKGNRIPVDWGYSVYTDFLIDGIENSSRFDLYTPRDIHDYAANLTTIRKPTQHPLLKLSESKSQELISNVYETLISFNDTHPPPLISGVGYNLTLAEYSNLKVSAPVIATALPTIINSDIQSLGEWGEYWTFTINSSATFQTWIDSSGATRPRRPVNTDDVVYSFQRQMVMDLVDSSVWMWFKPAFNITSFDNLYPTDSGPNHNGFNNATGDERAVANMIQQWCFKGDPTGAHTDTMVTFNFSHPLPDFEMMQTFSQTCGSVVNMDFMIEHGCWNYSWYDGWSADYRRMPDTIGKRTPIDRYYPAKSLYTTATPTVGLDVPDMCGTGPYKYTYGAWNQVNKVWILEYDPLYWRGWAHAGDKSGINFIHTIIEKGIDTWPTRKMLFLEGEFDVVDVQRTYMYDLLVNKYTPIAGLYFVYNIGASETSLGPEIYFERDWVQGWYYNLLMYPNLRAYNLYKSAPSSYTRVSLDITHTMTLETPTFTPYDRVYVVGDMKVLGGGGDEFNLTWDITVTLTGSVPFLFVVVGLERFNLTSLQLPAATWPSFQGPPWATPGGPSWFLAYNRSMGGSNKLFVPCQSPAYSTSIIITVYNTSIATATLTWHENGASIALPGNATWEIAGRAGLAPGFNSYYVTNPDLTYVDSNYNCTAWTNTCETSVDSVAQDFYAVTVGDINHDGTVDLLDAILLSSSFLTSFGEPGYNRAADLNNDGTIDLSDAILLSSNFGAWSVPPPP
jgi:hypothetical protein